MARRLFDSESRWQLLAARIPLLTAVAVTFAGLNRGVGVALALNQPSAHADLRTLHDWCRRWLIEGGCLYSAPNSATDYPPHAIVFLSPIALLPFEQLVPVCAALTLALTPLLAYFVVRSMSPRTRLSAAAMPVLLFLCWGGVRTLLQFSRFSLTLAFAAAVFADSRAVPSGICLGIALAKPHIAG